MEERLLKTVKPLPDDEQARIILEYEEFVRVNLK